jgi:Putative Flp pilus-assembly TadE/G-like
MLRRPQLQRARLAHPESGAALIITAAGMLALLIVAAYALNTAVWWVHHSHLQTQADAAAFAGAQALQFPCTSASNGRITATVHEYDGRGVYNPQVGPYTPETTATVYGGGRSEHLLIDELNEPNFTHQSQPGESGLNHSPCQEAFVDVKMTETNLPSFFPFAVPEYVNAQARVSIQQQT